MCQNTGARFNGSERHISRPSFTSQVSCSIITDEAHVRDMVRGSDTERDGRPYGRGSDRGVKELKTERKEHKEK